MGTKRRLDDKAFDEALATHALVLDAADRKAVFETACWLDDGLIALRQAYPRLADPDPDAGQ